MDIRDRFTNRIKGLLFYVLGIPATVALIFSLWGWVGVAWHWMRYCWTNG